MSSGFQTTICSVSKTPRHSDKEAPARALRARTLVRGMGGLPQRGEVPILSGGDPYNEISDANRTRSRERQHVRGGHGRWPRPRQGLPARRGCSHRTCSRGGRAVALMPAIGGGAFNGAGGDWQLLAASGKDAGRSGKSGKKAKSKNDSGKSGKSGKKATPAALVDVADPFDEEPKGDYGAGDGKNEPPVDKGQIDKNGDPFDSKGTTPPDSNDESQQGKNGAGKFGPDGKLDPGGKYDSGKVVVGDAPPADAGPSPDDRATEPRDDGAHEKPAPGSDATTDDAESGGETPAKKDGVNPSKGSSAGSSSTKATAAGVENPSPPRASGGESPESGSGAGTKASTASESTPAAAVAGSTETKPGTTATGEEADDGFQAAEIDVSVGVGAVAGDSPGDSAGKAAGFVLIAFGLIAGAGILFQVFRPRPA